MKSVSIVVAAVLAAACGGDDPEGVVMEGPWVGELRSGFLISGSSTVTLDVEQASTGDPVAATLVFGEGPPPAPPVDAEVGWPTGLDPLLAGAVPVADGVVYEVVGGARTGDQLRLDLNVTALWEPWCALQTPHQILPGSDEAQCLPNRPWTATPFECHLEADGEDERAEVDCLKLTLCRRARVCACTTTAGCTPSTRGMTLYLDLAFRQDSATGAFVWAIEGMGGGSAQVHFTRR
ncbi:MAG: hypothetical protein KF901_05060 [Myxococcales bacterium]|nr:hypothetical protein [Myxococcales bacterium]